MKPIMGINPPFVSRNSDNPHLQDRRLLATRNGSGIRPPASGKSYAGAVGEATDMPWATM
jgi:hypothetical protein